MVRTIFFFLLIFSLNAQAEVAGRLRLGEDYFFKNQSPPVKRDETSLVAELEYKAQLSESTIFRFQPHVRTSSAPLIVQSPVDGDLRDTQLAYKRGSVDLAVGSFVKVWEGTDGLNPMDLASMKNFRDPLSAENLSSYGMTLGSDHGFFSWDVLYVPFQTPSRLPGENSPWFPRRINLPLQTDQQVLLLPDQPVYQALGRQERNNALKNNAGARIQLHGESVDFSLAGFDGAAQTPFLSYEVDSAVVDAGTPIVIQASNPIGLRSTDYRRRSAGMAFSWTHDTWIFRVAARDDRTTSDDPNLPIWSRQSVTGLEKTFVIRDQSVVFLLQWAYGDKPQTNGLISSTDLFQRAILYGFRWPWSETLLFNYSGFWDTRGSSYFNRFGFVKKISDAWSFDLGADTFRGPPNSLIGIWGDQNRVTSGLMYQF